MPSRRALLTTTSTAALAGFAVAPDRDGETRRERRNRRLVMTAFERQNAGGSFYDVLADDVRWSIVNGNSYRDKQDFLTNGAAPVLDRLRTTLVMKPLDTWVDGDTVIAWFEADATTLEGWAYHNEYCWILRLRRDQVVRVNAFLDLVALQDLIDRVELPA